MCEAIVGGGDVWEKASVPRASVLDASRPLFAWRVSFRARFVRGWLRVRCSCYHRGMDTNETYSEDAANASRLKTAAPAAVADPEPDSEPERDGLPPRQRRVVLGIMVSGTTAACISQSMMIAALPAVMHEYGISASSVVEQNRLQTSHNAPSVVK